MNIVEILKHVNKHGNIEELLFGLISGHRPAITDKIDGYESIEYYEIHDYADSFVGVFKLGDKIYRGELAIDSYGEIITPIEQMISGIKEAVPKEVTRVEYEAV